MFRMILILLSLLAQPGSSEPKLSQDAETIVVFVQSDQDQLFMQQSLPKLKQYCRAEGLALQIKEVRDGAPTDLSSSPAIYFQTQRKRLLYAGRYTQFSSIENFVRSSRFLPPSENAFCKNQVWVKEDGRMQIMVAAKITPLRGTPLSVEEQKRFAKQAQEGISQGLTQFKAREKACLRKSDRIYYLDFHPYRDASGNLFLSTELYSQFSCIAPVFSRLDQPWEGTDSAVKALFAQAAAQLASELSQQMQSSQIGDAISPIGAEIPEAKWESLGLAFAEGATLPTPTQALTQLQGQWQYAGSPDPRIPALSFHFQQPLERYAGEVRELSAELQFDEQNRLLAGEVEVEVASLSMGMPDLDEKVLRKYLKAQKYPRASFSFDLKDAPLAFAEAGQTKALQGRFTLMKHSIDLPVQLSLQTLTDDKGQPALLAQGQFQLRITEDFGIEGPDGPSPNRETMIFYFSLSFTPQN
ncbi:MAG: YceI family protein [Bacteroidota bacterium]